MQDFYSAVICKDPRFGDAARNCDLALLEPITRSLVQQMIAAAKQMGIEVMVYEAYRSQQRQQALFDQGASKLPRVGVHHFGLACDIVRTVGGEPCWKGDFTFLGQLARSSALIWGGDWGNPEIKHSFVDLVHVQRCTVARQADLFAGRWYPDSSYNPYREDPHILFASVTGNQTIAPRPSLPQRGTQKKA